MREDLDAGELEIQKSALPYTRLTGPKFCKFYNSCYRYLKMKLFHTTE